MAGLAAAFIGLSGIVFAGSGNPAAEPSHVAGQIMVKFRDHLAAAGVLRQHGLSEGPSIGSTAAHLIKVPAGIRSISALMPSRCRCSSASLTSGSVSDCWTRAFRTAKMLVSRD